MFIDPHLAIVKTKLLYLTLTTKIYFFTMNRNLRDDVSFQEDLMFYFQCEQCFYFMFFKSIFLLIVKFSHGKISWLYIQNKIQHGGIKDSLSA